MKYNLVVHIFIFGVSKVSLLSSFVVVGVLYLLATVDAKLYSCKYKPNLVFRFFFCIYFAFTPLKKLLLNFPTNK